MIKGFKGKVIYIDEDNIYFVNDIDCVEIYNNNQKEWILDQEYFLYIYQYKTVLNKNIETIINFGFKNLKDCIFFKNILSLNGIGVKTAYKLLQYGVNNIDTFLQSHNQFEIMQHFNISERIAESLLKFSNWKSQEKLTDFELKKINQAITNLQELGYSKELSTKIVWNRKKEVILNNFTSIFSILINDIKNERLRY